MNTGPEKIVPQVWHSNYLKIHGSINKVGVLVEIIKNHAQQYCAVVSLFKIVGAGS